MHADEKRHVCGVCGKRFTRKSHLNEHHLIHAGEKPHVCDVCGKRFTQKSTLLYHRFVHTGEKPHKCDICGKQFKQKNALHKHRFIHTGEKPHVCEVCGKQFTQKGNLNTHRLLHAGEKPHMCDVCGKPFTQKAHLHQHYFIHSGEKLHVCDICGKRFARKDDLKKHRLSHAGEKPHVCDVCGKRFTRKSVLKKHHLIHTADKPHTCDICGRDFALKRDLNRHFQTCNGRIETFKIPRENVERDVSTDCHAGHRTRRHAGVEFTESVLSKFPKANSERIDNLEGCHTSQSGPIFHGESNTEAANDPAPFRVGQNIESQLCSFTQPTCVNERLQKPCDSISQSSHPASLEDIVIDIETVSLPQSADCPLPQALELPTSTNDGFRTTASASHVRPAVPYSEPVDHSPPMTGGDNARGSSFSFSIGGALYHCEKCDALFSQKVVYDYHCLQH